MPNILRTYGRARRSDRSILLLRIYLTILQFWKQFFEASANVSLNSYEEPTAEETVTETETTMTETNEPSTSSYLSTPSRESAVPDFATPVSAKTYSTFQGDESLDFESPEATPRAGQGRNQPSASLAQYASPYEKLRREVQGNDEPSTPSSTLPSTPRGQTASEDPDDSTFMKPSTTRLHAQKQNARTPANDPLLHRVLDKNYRIQATPHSQVRLPSRSGAGGFELHTRTPVTGRRLPARGAADDLDSSPMMEAPKLNAEIFKSPAKSKRVPGVSVLTPAKKTVSQRDVDEDMQEDAKPLEATKMKSAKVWDSDSDDDDDEGLLEGMSPPKTMQFHIPQSKLLRTPGRWIHATSGCG